MRLPVIAVKLTLWLCYLVITGYQKLYIYSCISTMTWI